MLRISYNLNIRGFGIRGFGIRGFGKGKSFCMRKFIVSVIVALVVLCGAGLYVFKTNDVSETYENKESNEVNNNMLSMMLETSAGSGEYQQTTASTWPTTGYVFNESLSKCEKGSSLSWDNTNKNVVLKGNASDKCYVYFDAYAAPKFCSKDGTVDFDNGYLVFNICYESSLESSTLHIVENSRGNSGIGVFENESHEIDINVNKNTTAYKVKYNCDSNYIQGDNINFTATIVEGSVTSDIKNFNIVVTVDIENYCYQ